MATWTCNADGSYDIAYAGVTGAAYAARPNQEKVRSTTQRRGSTTKPFMSSDCLTIFDAQRGKLDERVSDLASVVAGIGPHEFEPGMSSTAPAPSRSCMPAE